jgi:hypothetical protein
MNLATYCLPIGVLEAVLPMCASGKSIILINAGRFSLAAALALVVTAAIPADTGSAAQGHVDVATLAGKVLLTVLGINDAMAKKDTGDDGGNDNGGYQAGCSDNHTSNSPNSAKNCKKIGGDDSNDGSSGSDGGVDTNAGDGGAANGGVVASFTFCDSGHHGAAGRLFELYANGRTAITKVRCN